MANSIFFDTSSCGKKEFQSSSLSCSVSCYLGYIQKGIKQYDASFIFECNHLEESGSKEAKASCIQEALFLTIRATDLNRFM